MTRGAEVTTRPVSARPKGGVTERAAHSKTPPFGRALNGRRVRVALALILYIPLLAHHGRALVAQTTRSDAPDQPARFTTVDLFVDPRGQRLAAYQLEFVADPARVTLVGVEGGAHPAFTEPPYYDPAALSGNRVILAALNTGTDLPHERTRVATLHLRVVAGEGEPTYQAKLEVAGNPEGNPIPADVAVGQGAKR
jgi:hypothetical protein